MVTELRRIKWEVHVVRMGEVKNACNIFVGTPAREETTRNT